MSLIAIFMASLLGSLHCAGMCGGFALFCSGSEAKTLSPNLAYNFGRLITYSTLGGIAGSVGKSINQSLLIPGGNNALAVILGILLISGGPAQLFGKLSISNSPIKGRLARLYQTLINPIMKLPSVPRSLCIGMLSTLLPCPWLYAFVLMAATAGSFGMGVITMAVFWLGTLPIFLALGAASRGVLKKWGAQIPAITASLLIASGFFSILSHLGTFGAHAHHHHQHADHK